MYSRAPRKPKNKTEGKIFSPIKRVYLDVVGSMKHRALGTFKHFDTLLNEYSRNSMVRVTTINVRQPSGLFRL